MTLMLVIGAIVLYILMEASMFVISHIIMNHVLEIKRDVSLPLAIIAGLFFPITIALLVIGMLIAIIVWFVRSEL